MGCGRRPSDCYCRNFRVKGATFRYEWCHPVVDDIARLHVGGKCAKSGFAYKRETVENHERCVERFRTGISKRKPKETTFPVLRIDDGRAFQIGHDVYYDEWRECARAR